MALRIREQTKRGRALEEAVIAGILLGIAGTYAVLAYNLPERNIPGSVGLSFVPLLLAALLAFVALLLLVQARRQSGSPQEPSVPGWAQAGAVVGLMALYIGSMALMPTGFLLATPPYVTIAMWQCGARRPGFIALMAVGLTGAVWLIFSTLFAVPLPRGALF